MLQKMVKNDVCCCGVCKHCHCKRHQGLKERELAFLLCLRQIPFLPVCAFAMGDGVNDQSDRIVFAPFYLLEPSESFERLIETGLLLQGLADKGFISLNYQLPLQGYDYLDYWQSNAYKTYCEAVLSGKENGALCSTPKLYCGSLALTMLGAALMDEWEIA